MRDSVVRVSVALATTLVAAAVFGTRSGQLGATPAPLDPGDSIGGMRLERVSNYGDIVSIFDFCNPLILVSGLTHRHCTVPQTSRLFIGTGDFETTYPALNRAWRRDRWRLLVDGHEVRLARFGTDDRILYSYPPGSGHNSILREWRVALVHPSPGIHRIRYLTYSKSGAVTDVTWTVTVRHLTHRSGTTDGTWVIPIP
jgi:hypothetical protein